MALTINGSIASINARRQLEKHTDALSKTFQRLSSGMRVNTSKDDAAGLAIVNRMTAQIRGMNMASRNANDGISLTQVAEGALNETTAALQRIRELAVQAANSTYSNADRTNLNNEVTQMLAEVTRIADTTKFNGVKLLGDTAAFSATFQIGQDMGNTLNMKISLATAAALGVTAVTTSTQAGASAAIGVVDSALDSVSTIRATLGAVQGRFENIIANMSNVVENTDSARSRIQDADIALETANLTKQTILQQAGVAILAQANQQPTIALALLSGR
ncbi:MAG: flagellin FliC [Magnetococcales bacterium]|nr:flagellin FliC [Magnetococcales bacterium]MBF0438853.1 flagellin FliC [Magnetococcales bacterium]